jgi:cytochrome P450
MGTLPAGPSSILGPLARYLVDPYGVFPACARRYGDPFHLPIPTTRGTVVTGDPEGIREVMTADPDTFEPFKTEALEHVMGRTSIFGLRGPAHREARRLVGPCLHGAGLRRHVATMGRVVREHTRDLAPGTRFSLEARAKRIALEIIVRTIFGVTAPARVDVFRHAIDEGLDAVGPEVLYIRWLRRDFGGFGPWSRAKRMIRRLMRLIDEEIAARRATPGGDDVLGQLLAVQTEDGASLEDEEIRDKLYDLLVAGYETSRGASAWAAYEIARHPGVRDRLLAELAPLGADPDPEALLALPYLEAVCHETLRRHPMLVLVSRRLAAPFTLRGRRLEPGLAVSISIGLAHFREAAYPDPRAFRPERFLSRSFSPWEFLPFGGGAKRCIGAAYGLCEMKVLLGTLFARHRPALARRWPVRPAPRAITVAPAGAIEMVAR